MTREISELTQTNKKLFKVKPKFRGFFHVKESQKTDKRLRNSDKIKVFFCLIYKKNEETAKNYEKMVKNFEKNLTTEMEKNLKLQRKIEQFENSKPKVR